MAQLITGSICLSDIPKDKIQIGKTGKKYLNICISEMQNVSAYGDTHTIYVSHSKEDSQAKSPQTTIGPGKKQAEAPVAPQAASYQPQPAPPVNTRVWSGSDDDMPF